MRINKVVKTSVLRIGMQCRNTQIKNDKIEGPSSERNASL